MSDGPVWNPIWDIEVFLEKSVAEDIEVIMLFDQIGRKTYVHVLNTQDVTWLEGLILLLNGDCENGIDFVSGICSIKSVCY